VYFNPEILRRVMRKITLVRLEKNYSDSVGENCSGSAEKNYFNSVGEKLLRFCRRKFTVVL
jgi:hypothetical protein